LLVGGGGWEDGVEGLDDLLEGFLGLLVLGEEVGALEVFEGGEGEAEDCDGDGAVRDGGEGLLEGGVEGLRWGLGGFDRGV